MTAVVLRGDARRLPLPDGSVDLIVTSPPFWQLRSYTDGGVHYDGQIGSEPTPGEYVDALLDCTREWVRVLKPSGSLFVELGDAYSSGQSLDNDMTVGDAGWLAGLIDADGCVTVRRAQQPTMRAPTFEGVIAVEQEDRQAVERAHAITGRGHIATITGSRGKPMYRWTVSTQQARWVAERIWPWLRIKQRQALAVVELGRHREEHSARGRWNPIRPEWITYRERICKAVRAWNQREPDDWEPPALPVIELPLRPRFLPAKTLMGLPWRYALACMDELGLILRRDIIWSKPNGLPESVQDRCRSSHEYLFHFTVRPRYYAAVDEIREPHTEAWRSTGRAENRGTKAVNGGANQGFGLSGVTPREYNALGKLPGSVWEIPSQPLSVPAHLGVDHFACVDAETEILTPRGWLRHDQLVPGDQVAGYDLDSDTARWTECSAVSRYDYDGDLIAVESRDISMRLTPNHRTIVQRMEARIKRRSPVGVIRADELDRYHYIPRSVTWQPFGEVHASERVAALMGWVAAEGWYQGPCVYISQSLDANPQHVAEIDRLVRDGHRNDRKRNYQGHEYTEVTWRIGPVEALIQHHMPDKLLPWWLVMATEPERRAALDAFIAGDGHRRPDGRIGIFQKLRHNLDVLQAVAVTLGYKTTIREGGGRFVLYLTEGGRSVTLRGTSGAGSKVRREHYTGTVWCPTTGTGTFIARRNGSVFVTGNSFPMELPRRCILGWSPPGVCTVCGEGRRPVVAAEPVKSPKHADGSIMGSRRSPGDIRGWDGLPRFNMARELTGYACGCTPYTDHPGTGGGDLNPNPGDGAGRHNMPWLGGQDGRKGPWREYHLDGWTPPPTRPAVVVDPFGGTGTTALVASMLGRTGVSVDLSADYCRLARWRTTDPAERARALQVPKPPPVPDGQGSLFDDLEAS